MTELTSADHRQLITRLYDLHTRLAEITEQMNDIKARLRAQLGTGDYTINGKKTVTISPTRRFDPALAEQTLPPELLELCRVQKIDSGTAKKVLPPALYEQCMTQVGEPGVRLA